MKKVLSVILSIVMLFTIVPMSALAKESDAKPINLHKIDGENVPIHELKGLPEDAWDLKLHADEDGDYTFISGIANEKPFIAYSKDNINFRISYIDAYDEIYENYENVYGDVFWSKLEYVNNTLYIPCVFYELKEPDNPESFDYRIEYLITSDFEKWSITNTSPSEINLPESENFLDFKLIGEYNGIYVAQNMFDFVADEKTGNVSIAYYISRDGKNWEKKQTPYIMKGTIKGDSENYVETIPMVEISSVGVIFYVIESSVSIGGVSVRNSFPEYYVTSDFSNYTKLDLSALGKNKAEISKDKKQYYFDETTLLTTLVDNVPIILRKYGQVQVLDNGYSEKALNNCLEVYSLNKSTMKFEMINKIEDFNYYNYSFMTENNYVITYSELNEEHTYVCVEENATESYVYEWNELKASAFEYHYFVDDNIGSDGAAIFKYLIGVKDKQNLVVTDNLFKTTYELPLEGLAEHIYIEDSAKDESGIFISGNKTIGDEKVTVYYYINYDEVKQYINSQMPIKSGDINGDGNITAVDARMVLQIVAGLKSKDEVSLEIADVNGDGTISAVDARIILQVVAGLK